MIIRTESLLTGTTSTNRPFMTAVQNKIADTELKKAPIMTKTTERPSSDLILEPSVKGITINIQNKAITLAAATPKEPEGKSINPYFLKI